MLFTLNKVTFQRTAAQTVQSQQKKTLKEHRQKNHTVQ